MHLSSEPALLPGFGLVTQQFGSSAHAHVLKYCLRLNTQCRGIASHLLSDLRPCDREYTTNDANQALLHARFGTQLFYFVNELRQLG